MAAHEVRLKGACAAVPREYPVLYDALFRVYSRSGERIFFGGFESGGTRGRGRGRRRGVVGGDDGRRRGPIGAVRGRNGPFSARHGAKIPRIGGDDTIFPCSTRARALKRRSAFPDPAEAAFFAGIFDVSDFLGAFRAFSDPRLSRARRRGAMRPWRDVPCPFRGLKRSRTVRKRAVNAIREFFPP